MYWKSDENAAWFVLPQGMKVSEMTRVAPTDQTSCDETRGGGAHSLSITIATDISEFRQ
jgi:hypothetical protein